MSAFQQMPTGWTNARLKFEKFKSCKEPLKQALKGALEDKI
jgi:hypothetical protein